MILQVDNFTPDVKLETDMLDQSLRSLAANEILPSAVAKLLLDVVIYLPQYPEAALSQGDVARGRLSLPVHKLAGRNIVMAFSSRESLARFVKPGTEYAALPGRVLFDMWSPKDWLMLNAGSRYRLVLSPGEVSEVARGEIPQGFEIQLLDAPLR